MWLPMTKAEWQRDREFYEGSGLIDRFFPYLKNEAECILRNTDWLLERLYEPDSEVGARCAKWARCRFGAEPVNWGDLSCTEVRQFADGCWRVVLEEATAGECPKLCEYVRGWLQNWGWRVVVETTW
jgi:hypothetical protein